MQLSTRTGAAGLTAALIATLAAPVATAAPAERRAAFKPTLAASTATVVAGHRLVLSGRVKPVRKGTEVVLQKRIGDAKWRPEAVLSTTRKGGFTYRDKPTTPGVRHYRAVVREDGRIKAGTSASVKVTVYRWQNLTDLDVRRSSYTNDVSSVSINAHEYGPAFVGYAEPWANAGMVDWNLERQCLRLTGRVGNGDDSDDLATATIDIVADGGSRYSKTFALATSELKTLSLQGVFRLAFEWTADNPSGTSQQHGGAQATLAKAQVLCSF
ncbi:hypothetical protein [Nocardioides conyzicola]|uniref:Uncharacterized protein n=1 Tax=Nocardioides conyzicola TaxID=1651781 RepID=A0ABP8Y171_9ACTN